MLPLLPFFPNFQCSSLSYFQPSDTLHSKMMYHMGWRDGHLVDAVENVSLQIPHSTSSHNDLYVLGLRKKEKWGERQKIIVISFSAAETTVNKVSAFPIIIRLLLPFAASGKVTISWCSKGVQWSKLSVPCLTQCQVDAPRDGSSRRLQKGRIKNAKKHVKTELPCQKKHTVLLSH